MKLIKFRVGETNIYAYRKMGSEEQLVYHDKKGLEKWCCDLHNRIQLKVSIYDELDMPYCPRCYKDNVLEDGHTRVPYMGGNYFKEMNK